MASYVVQIIFNRSIMVWDTHVVVGAAAMPQGMSEDEALAAALAASMADVPAPPTSQAALSQVLWRKILKP